MIDWLHDLPPLQGAALVICVFLLPTLIGSILFQPMVGWLVSREKNANTPVGFLLNAFTLYYGVLLALLSIAVFENYNKAQDAIAREASSLIALYRNVIGYPEPMRASLVDNLRRYVEEETTPAAWRARSPDEFSTAGTSLVDEINRQLVTFKPEDQSRDEALHAATLRSFNDFIGRRRERIQAMGTSIPPDHLVCRADRSGVERLRPVAVRSQPRDPPHSRRRAELFHRPRHIHGGRARRSVPRRTRAWPGLSPLCARTNAPAVTPVPEIAP